MTSKTMRWQGMLSCTGDITVVYKTFVKSQNGIDFLEELGIDRRIIHN
jgi:hypothetical protein